MAKYHVNPNTGNTGVCKSEKGKCPFGGNSGDENHYKTAGEANQAAEKLMAEKYTEVNPSYRKKDTFAREDANRGINSEVKMDTESALSEMTDRIKNTDLKEIYLRARHAAENTKDGDDEYTVGVLKDNVNILRSVLVEQLGHNITDSVDSRKISKMSSGDMDTETALSNMGDQIRNTDLKETYFRARRAVENAEDGDDEYTVDILEDNADTLRNVLVDYLHKRDFELDDEYENWGKNLPLD